MAAQYGTMVLRRRNGIEMPVDCYFDDVATNPVRFDSGAGASATSDTFYIVDGQVAIVDVVLAAATTQTKTQIMRNAIPVGAMLRNSLHLASVVTRPRLFIPFNPGQKITMTQIA